MAVLLFKNNSRCSHRPTFYLVSISWRLQQCQIWVLFHESNMIGQFHIIQNKISCKGVTVVGQQFVTGNIGVYLSPLVCREPSSAVNTKHMAFHKAFSVSCPSLYSVLYTDLLFTPHLILLVSTLFTTLLSFPPPWSLTIYLLCIIQIVIHLGYSDCHTHQKLISYYTYIRESRKYFLLGSGLLHSG